MRILIVTQYHQPEPSLVTNSLISELRERGHKISVLTGFPNYPAGELYEGWRQGFGWKELEDGVEVWRTPLFVDHSDRMWARILNYISFGISSATLRTASRDVDVIYVYATQMTAAFGPWLWRIFGGRPYVLHVQDLWPESISGSSLSGNGVKAKLISALLRPWLKSVYRRSSHVIGIAPSMVKSLRARTAARVPVSLVYNWADASQLNDDEFVPKQDDITRVVYAGNVGDMQNLDIAISAAARAADARIELLIVGAGVARASLEELAEKLGARNVRFRSPVPLEEMQRVYRESHFGLVSLKNLDVFRGTIPSKFQALMAAGLPAICTVQGDLRDICVQFNVGFTADADSVDDLERAFRIAAQASHISRTAMARNARELNEDLFSTRRSVDQIEMILANASESAPV